MVSQVETIMTADSLRLTAYGSLPTAASKTYSPGCGWGGTSV
jgi:hypothetical protein